MNKILRRNFSLAALFIFVSSFIGSQSAIAQGSSAKGTTELFIYDPKNSGTVAVSYVNKFGRLAALLVQPHTVPKTACGYLFKNLEGLQLSTAQFGIDLSSDTNVTDRAVIILFGTTDGHNAIRHVALGENPSFFFPSGEGWTSFRYNPDRFSPAIGSNERLVSLSLSLLGGNPPSTHHDHWASHPFVNGRFQSEIMNHFEDLSNTDGATVFVKGVKF